MGSRSFRVSAALAVLILLSTPVAMAQGGSPSPEQLWIFEADGGAAVTDVASDADGKVLAAVQADASAVRNDDNEVYAWDLTRSKTSGSPDLQDDPSRSIGDPEGLREVAIHPNPGGKGDLIAVGDEGSSDNNRNNVYVYRRSAGGDSETAVSYGEDRSAPEGAVVNMWFLDRSTLLVEHENALSLLEYETGTQFKESQAGRWDPTDDDTASDQEETIRAVSVSQAEDKVAVLTSRGGGTSDDTLVLRMLDYDESEGGLESTVEQWTRENVEVEGDVALSRNAQFAVVATGSNTFYYMGLQENPDDGPDQQFSELPWSRNGPDTVSTLGISPNGRTLAASFANGELVVYQQTEVTDEGPRAEPVHDSTVQTGSGADRLTFADGNQTLFVQSAGLMAFHNRQFQQDENIRPLWNIGSSQDFAISQDGERIVVRGTTGDGGVVEAYEQSYDANLSLETTDEVQPGRAFNLTATIENRGSSLDGFRLSTDGLGNAWNVESPSEPLRLLPGETGTTTLTITPSRTQSPGEVTFSVTAVSQEGPGQPDVATAETTVEVQEVHAAELGVDTSERSISRGETLTLEPEVTNAGNTREPIVLRVGQDASWTVSIDGEETSKASVRLDPGESDTATVEVTAPNDASKGTRNTLKLVAHPEDGGTQAKANVPVIVDPSYGAAFEVPEEPVEVEADETVNTDVTVINDGNTQDTLRLETSSEASNPQHLWGADLSTAEVTLEGDSRETVTVSVDVPRDAAEGDSATLTLTATSDSTGDQVGEASYQLEIPEETEDSPTSALLALAAAGLAALVVRRQQR
jgi:MYXO-CTERM domain-containing protein